MGCNVSRTRPAAGVPCSFAFAGALALSTLLPALGCRGRAGADCESNNATRCAWEKAVSNSRGDATGGEGRSDGSSLYRGAQEAPNEDANWDRASQILGEVWTLLGDGVDGQAVELRARAWCEGELSPGRQGDASWSCALIDPPRFEGRDLGLEVNADGIVALTAFNLGEGEALKLLNDAVEHWRALCLSKDFEPYQGRDRNGDFRGCPMRDGPLLVLSRFRPEVETPLWQVSLSVMPAG